MDQNLWELIKRPALDALRKIAQYETVETSGEADRRAMTAPDSSGQTVSFGGPGRGAEDLDGLQELVEGIHQRPNTAWKFALPGTDIADRSSLMVHEIAMVPLVLAQRCAVLGEQSINEETLARLYREHEPYLIDPDPRVDVIVPILGAIFEEGTKFKEYSVIEMSGSLYDAFSAVPHIKDRDRSSLQRATHAVKLENVKCIPGGYGEYFDICMDEAGEDALARFFQGMAVALPGRTTYAQVGYLARGWSAFATAGPSAPFTHLLRDYALRLDRIDDREPVQVSPAKAEEISSLAEALLKAHLSVRVAARRLANSYERDDDEDRIIDLCIALEALLGSGSGETVHRLSLRAAALLTRAGWSDSKEIYSATKDMYSYRSRVVHGTPGPHKKDLLDIGGMPIHASRFALAALCTLLRLALQNGGFNPAKLDDDYIFSAFDVAAGGFQQNDQEE
ncbi:hypothetical protein [Micromonospora sp. NPDC002717]|uniref:hypothetical protein n=1 Tax=Micromonospora sp. NPDC002717 TaxID=3154424 RepID=UPI00331733F2